ncbi:hypothetical protein AB0G60_02740 [Streptomyces angustmyceticus]|uniref:Uncharacterized protein n=1 Tax=Streptomyces angustmyceticus TaxID=285578 RepID=A0A5J4L8U1_9ACTN|nr:hypothetical protein [Streptomyces angustmyceticus]UAL65580.1 hypothetical protein K7396_02715 [Streptomyces angustmyceticus]GES27900.1 hypothetical protein San01_03870 [Streptomyces angustmyceticus]
MQLGLLIGLTRARVALLIAGLAWFVGLDAPIGIRTLIALLILAGIAADGLVEDQRTKIPAPAPTRYDTAA